MKKTLFSFTKYILKERFCNHIRSFSAVHAEFVIYKSNEEVMK